MKTKQLRYPKRLSPATATFDHPSIASKCEGSRDHGPNSTVIYCSLLRIDPEVFLQSNGFSHFVWHHQGGVVF